MAFVFLRQNAMVNDEKWLESLMTDLTIDLGKIPIVVIDEETAQKAAEYVEKIATTAIMRSMIKLVEPSEY